MGKSGFRAGNTGNGYYRYDFSYSLNGFTGTNATISISNNSLTITPTAGDASIAKTISFPGSTFYFIRTRIKRTGGSGWDGSVYYSTSGHGSSASYRKQQIEPSWDGTFKDIYSDMSSLTAGGTDWIDNRITALRFDYGSTTDDTFEIKFIEIYANNWPTGVDLDDLYIRKSYFTQGNLWAWGQNNVGQLGVEDRTNRSSPVQTVAGGTNWKQVSMGNIHSAGIKTDGTLWMWGSNTNGQLGTNDTISHSSPVQTVSGGNDWKQVSAGGYHTSAIKTDGTLWIWGRNNEGQLGTNDIVHRSSPVQTVSGGNDWKQISIGERHSAAIKTDGTLWMWGLNSLGQLGTNDTTNHSSPVQTVSGGNDWKQVSAGRSHTAAVKIDGTLWVWGSNSGGQLGTNDTTNHSSPVQTISGGNDWKQVFSGMSTDSTSGHTIAIKNDGTLWAWGRNTEGQLGINDITSRSSPVQTLSGVSTWKNISAGANSSSAIRES